jgi:GNAT superfamily N-acetyltransferase
MNVLYGIEPDLSVDEFCDVLERSTLAARRPMTNRPVMEGMVRHADILVTARIDGRLVGVSRAITDYSYCTYLADLAVDRVCQGQGIGRALIERTHEEAGRHTLLLLLAAPDAESYYPHIGMQQHHSCWIIPRQTPTPS